MIVLSPAIMGQNSLYTHAVGYVRALEVKLLKQSYLNRLSDASNTNDLLKILQETSYGESFHDASGLSRYERVFTKELKEVYDLISSISPEPELIDIIKQRYDFHNVKVFLKSRVLGENPEDSISPLGTVDPDLIRQALEKEDLSLLPDFLQQAAREVEGWSENADDLLRLSLYLDKAYYRAARKRADRSGVLFLRNLIGARIDLTNIRTIVRLSRMKADRKLLGEALIDGGLIDLDSLQSVGSGDLESLPGWLSLFPYEDIEEGIHEYLKSGSLTELEVKIMMFFCQYAEQAGLVAMGVEPLLAYLLAKETEIAALRMTLVGKLNDLSAETIKNRLAGFPLPK
ncbi:MAG: V-type ATPase subunit [bacterium]